MYVNYGRQNDFRYLTRHLGLNLNNHICIVRYGEIFRGDKVTLEKTLLDCCGYLNWPVHRTFEKGVQIEIMAIVSSLRELSI